MCARKSRGWTDRVGAPAVDNVERDDESSHSRFGAWPNSTMTTINGTAKTTHWVYCRHNCSVHRLVFQILLMTHIDSTKARRHISRRDPVLKTVMQLVGPYTLKPQPGGYRMLVRSILSQQISTAAARTIRGRLQALLPGGRLAVNAIDSLSDEQLQSVGVSAQKRGYLRDLTRCTLDGTVNFRRISRLDDEAVIEELIQVKGIGRWTAQMFLLFSLGRPDVFAPDDLGIRNAMIRLYGLQEKPSRDHLDQIADPWKPHRSVACWYLWRALDQNVICR
jgi:DNA-3-methyladenine glycosylase II